MVGKPWKNATVLLPGEEASTRIYSYVLPDEAVVNVFLGNGDMFLAKAEERMCCLVVILKAKEISLRLIFESKQQLGY